MLAAAAREPLAARHDPARRRRARCSSDARERAARRAAPARGPRARRRSSGRRGCARRRGGGVDEHHRRDRADPADPGPAGDARARDRHRRRRPRRRRRRLLRRRCGQQRRGSSTGAPPAPAPGAGHRPGPRGRGGPQVPRRALRLGRHRPGHRAGLLGPGAAGLLRPRHRPAPRVRRPGPGRAPPVAEPGPGPARRPDRSDNFGRNRRRPHRDLPRRRPDDRGAAPRAWTCGSSTGLRRPRRASGGSCPDPAACASVSAGRPARPGRRPATPYADLFSAAGAQVRRRPAPAGRRRPPGVGLRRRAPSARPAPRG